MKKGDHERSRIAEVTKPMSSHFFIQTLHQTSYVLGPVSMAPMAPPFLGGDRWDEACRPEVDGTCSQHLLERRGVTRWKRARPKPLPSHPGSPARTPQVQEGPRYASEKVIGHPDGPKRPIRPNLQAETLQSGPRPWSPSRLRPLDVVGDRGVSVVEFGSSVQRGGLCGLLKHEPKPNGKVLSLPNSIELGRIIRNHGFMLSD